MVFSHVHDPRDARADLDELRPTGSSVLLLGLGIPGTIEPMRAPDGEVVIVVGLGHEVEVSMAEPLAVAVRKLEVTAGTQLMVLAPCGLAVGFDVAFDAALDGEMNTTFVTRPPKDSEEEAALAAVPRPAGLPPVDARMTVSEADLDRLIAGYYADEKKRETMHRLVPVDSDEAVSTHWTYLYWLSDRWELTMLARAFFDTHGIAYQIVQDTGDNDFGILTDFATALTRQKEERRALQQQMRRKKAMASEDPLIRMFAAESFEKES